MSGLLTGGDWVSSLLSQELLERGPELAQLEQQLALAADGRGGLLLIAGPAGIGKTSLCEAGAASARRAGMRVLSARGGELETGYAFGVLRQLFEPLLAAVTDADRQELLVGAAERGLVALEGADDDAPAPFGVIHGLYWLAVNASTLGPVAVVIDDVHWIDHASLRWLLYVGERIESLPIALVLAFRPGESADPESLIRLEQIANQRVVAPAPLTPDGARVLLERVFGAPCTDRFLAESHAVTGGNPFLLAELAGAMHADGLAPDDAATDSLLDVGPGAIARAVSLRLASLGPAAAELARAVAILGDGAALRQAAALAELPLEVAGTCAGRLAEVGLLAPGIPLRFVHAIMRSAIYEDMPAGERAVRHGTAAGLLSSMGADIEHVCAQLVRAEPGASGEAVAQLQAGAKRALGRGAPDNAAAYLLRAVDECADSRQRSALLHQLGQAEKLMFDERAVEHLREALALCEDRETQAEIGAELGDTLAMNGQWDAALEVIEAVRQSPRPGRSDLTSVDRVWGFLAGWDSQRADQFDRFLTDLIGRFESATEPMPAAAALIAAAVGFRGRDVELARQALSHAIRGALVHPANHDVSIMRLCNAAVALDELETLERLIEQILDLYRSHGAISGVALALAFRVAARSYRGELYGAEEDFRAVFELLQEHGPIFRPIALLWLGADALIERPELKDFTALVSAIELPPDVGRTAAAAMLHETRGRLALADGSMTAARAELEQAASLFTALQVMNPNVVRWRGALALTLEDREQALALAQSELEEARRVGSPRPIGIALRTLGMLEGGEAGMALLRDALDVLDGSPARLEHARTMVELGAALRRANQRVEAREPLRAGLDLAHRCGAMRLSEHARDELRATGARPRRVILSGADSLTAAERRVAGMAAGGMSNPEIAQALFVTINTVEGHLRHVYQKLAISSRKELPAGLGDREAVPA